MMYTKAGLDFIWFIIIAGSIIAQVIKDKKEAAERKKKRATAKHATPTDETFNPPEELKEFFEALTRPEPPPPPTPAPVRIPPEMAPKHHPIQPKKKPRRHITITRTTPPQDTTPTPTPPAEPPTPAIVPPQDSGAPPKKWADNRTSEVTQKIKLDLQDLDATRRAIVLREILGPPIALR